jgi:hypothetical protein
VAQPDPEDLFLRRNVPARFPVVHPASYDVGRPVCGPPAPVLCGSPHSHTWSSVYVEGLTALPTTPTTLLTGAD